jgi:nicotinate phosphoribosyltransferase
MSASRAAYIGGAAGTSNVMAGKELGIPVLGTMSHAWIMAFPSEEEAFQAYADLYPDKTIFLIDTYDTLKSGILNAVKVGKKLASQGRNFGVRLDSGDIHYLSEEVRKILDAEGLTKAAISVSNDLDEYIIHTLTNSKAPIDHWGVGTRMVTGGNEASFTGVYKMSARDDENGSLQAVMKFSDNPEKTTDPGVKQVWRVKDSQGLLVVDVLSLEDKEAPDSIEAGKAYKFWHPSADYRHFTHTVTGSAEPLLQKKLEAGKFIKTGPRQSLDEIRAWVRRGLESLDHSYKRFLNPHIYKVSVTERLRALKLELLNTHLGGKHK